MADIVEIDIITGKILERNFTEDELAQQDLDRLTLENEQAEKNVAVLEKNKTQKNRKSALEKIKASAGLTPSEIKALFGE